MKQERKTSVIIIARVSLCYLTFKIWGDAKMKKVIMLVVFLTVFWISGPVLALAIEAPALTITPSGLHVAFSWTNVPDATEYILYYAPPDINFIGEIAMGTETSFSLELYEGAQFYVAVKAYNNSVSSGWSNIAYLEMSSSEPTAQTFTNSLGMTFQYVPAGNFIMGSSEDELGRGKDQILHYVYHDRGVYLHAYHQTEPGSVGGSDWQLPVIFKQLWR